MNETWLHSSAPGLQPFILLLASSPSSSELCALQTSVFSLVPEHTGTVDPTDALAHTQVSKEETNTEVTGLARAGQFSRL